MTQQKFLKIFIAGSAFVPAMLGINSVALSQISQQNINSCMQLNQGLQQENPTAQQYAQQNPNVVSYCRKVFNHINTTNSVTTQNAQVMCKKTRQRMQEHYDRDEMPSASTAAMLTYWCVNMGGQ